MTTNDIPTPYDKGIEAITYGSNGPTLAQQHQLQDLHALQDGYREGFSDAKARSAPLLEAAKDILWGIDHGFERLGSGREASLRAAIAAAEGRE